MDTDKNSPAGSSQQFAGQTEVTAFFDSQPEADKAVEALKAAGFNGADISVMPRSEEEDAGAVVAVSQSERLGEAAAIMQQCGGQIGRPGKGLGMMQQGAGGDTLEDARIFSSSSLAGGSGAGTASGGALF